MPSAAVAAAIVYVNPYAFALAGIKLILRHAADERRDLIGAPVRLILDFH